MPAAVIGIGIDSVEVDRFRTVLARRPGLAQRLFTDAEREAVSGGSADPTARLAARFAAKEAVMKALGVGLGSFSFRDVEVVSASSGAPSVILWRRAAALASSLGVESWRLSLTHTEMTAGAVAVAL
ncbi:MAG: holo-ACP synthase [Pseudonocardiaceae bacterium]